MKPSCVIVTRPARDADFWVQQLQHDGTQAEALPLIEIAPVSDEASQLALQRAWKTLDSYAACLFVSGNAVDSFFKPERAVDLYPYVQQAINSIAKKKCPALPPSLRLMAPGPGTVAALVSQGVPRKQIDAPSVHASQFDSEALWQVVGKRAWQGRRVLIVRGQSLVAGAGTAVASADSPGRDWIARQWQAAGAQVDYVGVYQRRAPELTLAQMQRARAASVDGSIWLFSSSEAVANLHNLMNPVPVDWSRARAVATHPRIADAARAAGWGVVVESRPALADIRKTLRSIESSYP